MKAQPSIEFHIHCPASEALQRISDATAQESFPFIEPVRPRDREFIGRVSGRNFRIWKWSARRRGRRNYMIPMLRGEIRHAGDGCDLSASFKLHPFAKIWTPLVVMIFLGISITIWLHGNDLRSRLFAGFFLLFACLLGYQLFDRRGRNQEERQIEAFVESLFRDVRT